MILIQSLLPNTYLSNLTGKIQTTECLETTTKNYLKYLFESKKDNLRPHDWKLNHNFLEIEFVNTLGISVRYDNIVGDYEDLKEIIIYLEQQLFEHSS